MVLPVDLITQPQTKPWIIFCNRHPGMGQLAITLLLTYLNITDSSCNQFGTIVDGWPAPKVTKYVNYNSRLNN